MNLQDLIHTMLKKSEQIEEDIVQNSILNELTYRQLNCVEIIYENKNPTITELSEKLGITKPSTTVLIDKLEEKGFVIKVKSDSDRRSAHIHLSDKGECAVKLHKEIHRKISDILSENLTGSEKDILVVLLDKALN